MSKALLPLLLALAVPLNGAGDLKHEIAERERGLQRVQREKKVKKEELRQVKRRERSVLGELQYMDRRMDELGAEIVDHRRLIGDSEERIAAARLSLRALESDLDASRLRLGRRLRQLYKSGRASTWSYLLRASNSAEFQRRLHYLRLVAAADARLIGQARAQQEELEEKRAALETESVRLLGSKQSLELDRRQIAAEKDRKQALSSRLKKEGLLLEQAIRDYQAQEEKLSGLIGRLYREKAKRESTAGATAGGFRLKRGHLPWPVEGRLLTRFGRQKHPEFNVYIDSKGIEIGAAYGAPIRAVSGGRVLYADWYAGYGKMIIVDHGDGYFSLYTHASGIAAAVGEQVTAGQVIGEVGSTGSLSGDQLYFEIRQRGEAIDPLPWLAAR